MSETPATYHVQPPAAELVDAAIEQVAAALDELELPEGLHLVVTLTPRGPRVQGWARDVSARAVVTTESGSTA